MNFKDSLHRRFDKYVRIETTANAESKSVPSSPGQSIFQKELQKELIELKINDSHLSETGYLYFTLAGNCTAPHIGFLAHVDTSDEASGKNVKPILHKNYDGKNLILNQTTTLSPEDFPDLLKCIGEDIITASGDTLLGADNKAGVAIIMTFVEFITKNPTIKHGPISVAFTPDEEIGRGVDHFDLSKFPAKYAYTVDGDITGFIENETFNADEAIIEVEGKSVHPGSAKGKMANAAWILSDIISSWPSHQLPETTEKFEGFIGFMSISGTVESARAKGIVRDHDLTKLKDKEELLQKIIEEKQKKYPLAKIKITFREQYRNMRQIIDQHPEVMSKLIAAISKTGINPTIKAVRGGTDGARLSFLGIPTPNIFVGGSNFHGRFEWVSLDGMNQSIQTLIELINEWSN